MKYLELIAPCHFGLEAVLKREILDLGYEISRVEDGKVTFLGDWDAVCCANIFLRSAERVLVKVGSFEAKTFDALFEATRALPWEEFIPRNGKFWVAKANSVRSRLFSPSDIQSIMKKAMVERLKEKYHTEWFPEDAESYPLRVTLMKDEVTVGLDTSGVSLHKRGYRKLTAKAPITETLASALILLTPWRGDRILVDPFCGSGTFPIEAAMMAAHMAPGMNRTFLAQSWKHLIPDSDWRENFAEARELADLSVQTDIQGYDSDPQVIRMARENARLAGVDHLIHFQQRAVEQLSHPKKYGFIITNPPYGERLKGEDGEGSGAGGEAGEAAAWLPGLYTQIGEAFARLDTWSKYVITSYEDAERYIGRKADKNRKIYNGMMKTYYYQFLGPKPPKKKTEN